MNITALFSVYYLNAQSQYVASDINIATSHSLRYVIDNFFMMYSSSFVYILSCQRQHTMNFFKDLMEILFSYWDTMKVQIVMNDKDTAHIGPGERNFNLILVDGADSFLNIDPASKVQNYDINEYYYVFVQNRDQYLADDIQRIFDYCWSNFLINVNILVQRASGELIIYTYFPFTETHCRKVIPVEINRFRNGTMVNEILFPEKLLNLYQCPLKVALWDVPPFLSLDPQKTGQDAIGGFEGELLKTLADVMNFRIDYITPPNDERKGTRVRNRTNGATGMLQRREVDLSLGFFQYTINKASTMTATSTYYQARQVIIVLKESPNYISPELIFYPFSPTIWALLVAHSVLVLAILMAGIHWDRRVSLGIAKISWNDVCINFVAITLGMASILSPRSHFGRLFMTTWMLSTLVIRSQYQALIFHLIRNNLFKLPPSSIQELIHQGYRFIMNPYTFKAISKIPFFKETNLEIQTLATAQATAFTYLEDHPKEKLAVVAPSDFLLYYGAKNRKAGVYVTLPETVLVQSMSIYMTKHSFLVNRINGLVRWVSASGLISSWVSRALDLSYYEVPPEAKQTTIGLDELEGVFYLSGLLLVVALIVFIFEVLSARYALFRRAFGRLC